MVCSQFVDKKFTDCSQLRNPARAPDHEPPKENGKAFSAFPSCQQLGAALHIVATMGEHPAIAGEFLPICLCPLAVIGGVPSHPTLEVVGAVGSEYLASSEIVSKMCHSYFLSFSGRLPLPCDYIIPQRKGFVNRFYEIISMFSHQSSIITFSRSAPQRLFCSIAQEALASFIFCSISWVLV